jgi:hypothetical protein
MHVGIQSVDDKYLQNKRECEHKDRLMMNKKKVRGVVTNPVVIS